jgi:hypothetical protein
VICSPRRRGRRAARRLPSSRRQRSRSIPSLTSSGRWLPTAVRPAWSPSSRLPRAGAGRFLSLWVSRRRLLLLLRPGCGSRAR